MKTRRQAREAVVQILYQCDTLNFWDISAVDVFINNFMEGEDFSPEDPIMLDFMRRLAVGVIENVAEIDDFLGNASENWSLVRMSRVDRNILRVAAYEMCIVTDIPPSVSINEAIEISKRFSCDDSPMFINGILDQIAGEVHRKKISAGPVLTKLKAVVNS